MPRYPKGSGVRPRKHYTPHGKVGRPKVSKVTKDYVKKVVKDNVNIEYLESTALESGSVLNDWSVFKNLNDFLGIGTSSEDAIIDNLEINIHFNNIATTEPILRMIVFQYKETGTPTYADFQTVNTRHPTATLRRIRPDIHILRDSTFTLNDVANPIKIFKIKLKKFMRVKKGTTNPLNCPYIMMVSDYATTQPTYYLTYSGSFHYV